MNTVAAILIVISSNSYGSSVDITRFDSISECLKAKEITVKVAEELGGFFTGPTIKARCEEIK